MRKRTEDNSRVCIPCSCDVPTSGMDLPLDVKDKAVTRLGWVALLFAATLHLVHWTRVSFTPLEGHADTAAIADAGLIAGTLLAVAVCALAWSRKVSQRRMLDLAVLFQVSVSLCLALMEYRIRIHSTGAIAGVSAIALWITFFVLVVPTSTGKAALGAVGSALMGPVALLVYTAAERVALPSAGRMLSVFGPDFLAAAWSLLLARYVYGMGRALGKARRMGYYELAERLGHGGMGEVWRAKHRMLARPAAIKLISKEAMGKTELTSTLIRRFEKEAQATASLQSPHTIQVYDFGVTEDGALYYVMEYLDGVDLQTLIDTYGPIPAERAVHFLLQMLESLEEAHQAQLIHRDIKPANIFVGKHGLHYDFVKVLDFGLVRTMQTTRNDGTLVQQLVGTPSFMAPEAAVNPGEADARSDLYGVGAVAYWLLTGTIVFDGVTRFEALLEQVRTLPMPPSQRTENEIPAALEQIIMECLDPDPRKRPQSADELTRRLEAIPFDTPWTPQRAEKWWRAHRPASVQRLPALSPEARGDRMFSGEAA